MANEKPTAAKAEKEVQPITTDIVNPTPKKGPVKLSQRVKVKTTASAPYHKADQEIEVAPAVAEKMKANGWAK